MRHPASCALLGIGFIALGCKGELVEPDFGGGGQPPGSTAPALALRLGGTGIDEVIDIVSDAAGNAYVAGNFTGAVDFDPGTGVTSLNSLGTTDAFVAKYSPVGALVWVARIGGTASETATALARDASGNLLLVGAFVGATDVDPGAANYFLASAGGEDGFVVKLGPGGEFRWGDRFGGGLADRVNAVAVDAAGNVYAAGSFSGSANALPQAGSTVLSQGGSDGFLLALDPAGEVRWVTAVGGNDADLALGVGVTATGTVALAGNFRSVADFAPGAALSQLSSTGGTDAFIASYSSGGALLWVHAIAGTGEQEAVQGGLATDPSAGIVVTGTFGGTTDLDPGAGTQSRTSLGAGDWFLVRFDAGGGFQSGFTGGGAASDPAPRPAFDEAHNLVVAGAFTGTVDFDPGVGTRFLTSLASAGSDAFVARYTSSGGLLWVSRFGEPTSISGRNTAATAMVSDGGGNFLTAGRFFGATDFDPGTSAFRLLSQGETDGFVVKLTSSGALAPPP